MYRKEVCHGGSAWESWGVSAGMCVMEGVSEKVGGVSAGMVWGVSRK